MKKSKISIIVPVYNLEKYIERSVKSICAQTYENIEIILVNDGSMDKSAEIIERLKNQDSRIIVIHQKNTGVTNARITGVKAATGDWIGFVDGDDYIDSDMYEHLIRNAEKYNSDISHCGYKMEFPNRIDNYYNTGKLLLQNNYEGLKDLLQGSFVEPGLWNKLYKSCLVRKLIDSGKMDFSIKNLEDLLMNFYLFKMAKCSIYEDFCPYHYIIRYGSAATSTINENKLRDPQRVFRIILDEVSEEKELSFIVSRRLLAQYISISAMSLKGYMNLDSYRSDARIRLRNMMLEIIRNPYSKKEKIQCLWVLIWPWSYNFVHKLYLSLSGGAKKYSVEE